MKYRSHIKEQQVTDETIFLQRRKILQALGIAGGTIAIPSMAFSEAKQWFDAQKKSDLTTLLTPESKITTYNNFYEFGWDKSDPARFENNFNTEDWKITIDGEVNRPMTLDMDDIFQQFSMEERIYRFRCVEAWSMVIPWIGFPLSDLLKLVEPTSKAKYVAFETLYDPQQFPNQNGRTFGGFEFPYIEGLRMDEAMHPLTILSTGLYGKRLLPQNGAPIRLVVPWKYGFKSIKSIVKIRLTETMPKTTWNLSAPHEYGFYANVNPAVSHPRWSQASERIIGTEGLFGSKRQETTLFNGYSEVAELYTGLDLKKNY